MFDWITTTKKQELANFGERRKQLTQLYQRCLFGSTRLQLSQRSTYKKSNRFWPRQSVLACWASRGRINLREEIGYAFLSYSHVSPKKPPQQSLYKLFWWLGSQCQCVDSIKGPTLFCQWSGLPIIKCVLLDTRYTFLIFNILTLGTHFYYRVYCHVNLDTFYVPPLSALSS